MKRHLRNIVGITVSAAALTVVAAAILGQAARDHIAPKLWPADDSQAVA